MKKHLISIFLVSLGIILFSSILAQQTTDNWSDVIKEEKGDTVVVMGFESCGYYNTLHTAIKGDTTATGERKNPNRVYETIPGETYIYDITLKLDNSVPLLHISAPLPTEGVRPPLHIKALKAEGFNKTFFQTPGNILMKNQYFLLVSINDSYSEREFMRCQCVGSHHEYRNCIFELGNWNQHVPFANRQTFKFIDCKFINVGNEATLEKGCVLETRTLPPDTVWFENCTFLNGGIFVLGLETTGPMFVYLNHNTIVNCVQPPLCFSTGAEMIVTNNLFVNAGMAADYPTFYPLFDDDDLLPKGLINLDTMEDEWIQNWYLDQNGNSFYPVAEEDRKVLFDRNSAWWDPRFETMINNTLPNQQPISADIGDYEWTSQMILMNERTKAMFDDSINYPFLNEGNNYNIQPDFVNNKDLINEWISFVVSNSTPGDPNDGDWMPKWRTHLTDSLYVPDWPMLADLSYNIDTLRTAGLNYFPLGDLNWFPEQKNSWVRTHESDTLLKALKTGTIPNNLDTTSTDIINKIIQPEISSVEIYPNPISTATKVKYNLTSGANVELTFYNLIGDKVRNIDLSYQTPGNKTITLKKGDLSPGMYILQISTGYNKAGVTAKIVVK